MSIATASATSARPRRSSFRLRLRRRRRIRLQVHRHVRNVRTSDRDVQRDDEIFNVRVGETIGRQFILRGIGIESVEIGYVGFPPDVHTRIPVGPRQ